MVGPNSNKRIYLKFLQNDVAQPKTATTLKGTNMAKKKTLAASTGRLYESVKQIIEEARSNVYHAANFAMVQAYWQIGKLIVERAILQYV